MKEVFQMSTRFNYDESNKSMSLKNKLLLAFIFVGIIPSLIIGFLMYSKSDASIDKMIFSNMYNSMKFLSFDYEYISQIQNDGGTTILIKDNIIENEDEFTIDLIERMNNEAYYDLDKKIKILEYQGLICGALEFTNDNVTVYHYHRISEMHPWIDDTGTIFIKVSLIIITLSIGLSIGISYNITHGIFRLMNYTKRVEKGELDFNIKVERNDEIGTLTHSFNNMTKQLNELINKTYKLEISESEARFKALQAQISPHFLYNALDTINWSLIDKGDYETSKILGSLSEILRYSIDYNKGMVTLGEEMRQLENYLRIQKGRFENRFDYEVDFDDGLSKYKIPKLLLQPLVENAVVHGVEKVTSGGKILVKAVDSQDSIDIEIIDNGNGISPEKLEKINEQLKKNQKDVNDRIGLLNVNDRIKLIYGDSYFLSIESSSKGTKAHITIGKLDEKVISDSNDITY
jgi:sensor histidine kinase YesM